MISWLKGQIIQNWQISSRKGIVLNVGGVGYEIQLLSNKIDIIDESESICLWIHQINREDYTNLYGFTELSQRDLFRIIIGVNGIGPQIAMSLLEDLKVSSFVDAIEENDLSILTKSQGGGKRIAERLVVELKNKLQQFKDNKVANNDDQNRIQSNNLTKYQEEIKSILNSLGYMDNEIKEAIELITTNQNEIALVSNATSGEEKAELMDRHLKEILIRLSQNST